MPAAGTQTPMTPEKLEQLAKALRRSAPRRGSKTAAGHLEAAAKEIRLLRGEREKLKQALNDWVNGCAVVGSSEPQAIWDAWAKSSQALLDATADLRGEPDPDNG